MLVIRVYVRLAIRSRRTSTRAISNSRKLFRRITLHFPLKNEISIALGEILSTAERVSQRHARGTQGLMIIWTFLIRRKQ
jgi:hypothetical protein